MPGLEGGLARAGIGWALVVLVLAVLGVWMIGPAFAESPHAATGGERIPPQVAAPVQTPSSAPRPAGNATLVDAGWAGRVAGATGIPVRALVGYAGAELALSREQPDCHMGWTTLAALGVIESAHGTHAGAAIGPDGVTRPGVWGPDLNGVGTALIRDTDAGAIDGTALADRAVGPLQFIPATWQQWGADGNADGIADPQQIDDAALAAARYLCHYGDMSNAADWRAAIFAYNHLDSYVNDVAAAANVYAAASQ